MTTLIVTLSQAPWDAATLYDYVLTPDGSTVAEHSRVPLALLPQLERAGGVVVALVPIRQLSWHQVQLPVGALSRSFLQEGGEPRLRAVLEGLLEDRLLDETAQLHFAMEPAASADGPVWVAVCDRAWLRGALHVLEQSGRPVSRIVPEFTPQALADEFHVIGEPGDASVVCASRGSVVAWPLSVVSVGLLNPPDTAAVVAEPVMAALAEQLFKRPVTLQQSAQRCVQALQSSWDLAQFDLVNSGRARTWKRLSAGMLGFARSSRWRPARVALLSLLVVNLVGLNAWAWKEQSRINAKRAAINEVLTSTFPSVRVVVDAPIQMAREVALVQRGTGAPSRHDLDVMLDAFGSIAPENSAVNAVEFVAGELRLKGIQLAPEYVTQASFKLQPLGYRLTVEKESLLLKQEAVP
ncbi:type II secretion system protein GspL [Rhodoferax sp.]|uniref:type II secretion system protein GspL n=1 Tax=Rhodoferax sp. TaxID=50421 RepID=UPI001EB8C208|nr:type II secretion system protein GspL [Rhodoferax sp.]MBT9508330.1 general secretion pathway protein GspL [Rhodoferax sp.]